MARIDRQHRIAESEGGGTDQEVSERNHDTAALLLGIKLAGKPGDVYGQRVDGDGSKELLDEGSRRARRSAVSARWMPWTSSTTATVDRAAS